MNEQTEQRIKIISQFKSTFHVKDPSLEKRINKLKIWGIMNYGLVNLLLIIVMILSALTLLQVESFNQRWLQSGLLVLITLSVSLHSHYSYIEYLLLKHISHLKLRELNFNPTTNTELNGLVTDLNDHKFKPSWIMIHSILVILASALTVLEWNPFWGWFPLPVLVVSALLSWRINNHVFLVQNNIENLESEIVIN